MDFKHCYQTCQIYYELFVSNHLITNSRLNNHDILSLYDSRTTYMCHYWKIIKYLYIITVFAPIMNICLLIMFFLIIFTFSHI